MFKKIARAISRPIRGLGRIARGHVRKGLGDIGAGVKSAAPLLGAIPGVGTAAAIGIGALGGGLERAGRKGANIGNVLSRAGQGGGQAAIGAAVGKLAGGAGGGAGGAGGGVPGVAGTSMGRVGSAVGALREGAGAAAEGVGGRLANIGGRLAGFAKENPVVTAQLAGSGLEAYGAHQMGRAQDRQLALQEEAMKRQWGREDSTDEVRRQILAQIMRGEGTRQPFDEWRAGRA